ncbi:MAG: phosphoenolpyruvate--protein phosphotransferase, partial [Deltaproteobacteria bacterium]|nr:phosphoenolpyruvate--protein phosphotransferase [Deltaproteobacteria bacterium]
MTSRRVQLRGIGISPGIAMGKALIMERESVPVLRLPLAPGQIEHEVRRLSQAVEASRAQLQTVKDRLSGEVGVPHAYIFDAQMLMLEDPLLVDRSVGVIREDRVNAEWAVHTVSEQLHTLFDGFTDAYLKERSTDLDDVLGRIQLNLAGETDAPSLSRLPEPFVLVADDLTPSEAAGLDWKKVLAVVTDAGSRTYHTAIVTRSLGIPGVVGLKDASHRIPPGALVVVDGATGEVVVEPSGRALSGYRAAQKRDRKEERRLQETRDLAGVTRDGTPVRLRANAEFP